MFWGSSLPVFVCIILQSNGFLFHGQSNISAPSTEQKDHNIYMKQLLHLETTLNSVLLDFASLKLENQRLQQEQKLYEQQQTLLEAQIGAFNHTTTLLLSENIAMKHKLDKLDSKTMYLQQNMTTLDDVRMLEKIITFNLEQTIQENEQEFMKNISGIIKELQWKDHSILLLLSDVDNRTKNVENRTKNVENRTKNVENRTKNVENRTKNVDNRTKTLEYSVTHLENQQLLTKNDVQNMSQSLGIDVAKLKDSLLKLQTDVAYTVAFSAGANGGYNVYNAGETVMFPNISYAVGGGYDRGTGVFTVPKSGLYIIFCNILAENLKQFWAKIMINGIAKAGVMAHFGSSVNTFYTGSNLIVQNLQVNDRVWIQTVHSGSLLTFYKDTIFTVVMIKSLE